MSTSTSLLTVAEFLKLPDPKEGHLELHHGEIVIMAPPKWRHQKLQDRIAALLRLQLNELGVVMTEMGFQPAPEFEFWIADVGYVAMEREHSIEDYLQGSPDLVVEVLSPSNTAAEIDDRRATCMAHGCKSFWVVNDKHRIVSVTEENVTRHYTGSQNIVSIFLPEAVSVDDLLK